MKPTYANLVRVTARAANVDPTPLRRTLRVFFEQLAEVVWAKGRFMVPGLGTFEVRARKARRIVDPRDPLRVKLMKLPATRRVRALVAKSWRARG